MVVRAEEIVLRAVTVALSCFLEGCSLSSFLIRFPLLFHSLLSSEQGRFTFELGLRWSIALALRFAFLELSEIAFDFIDGAMVALFGPNATRPLSLLANWDRPVGRRGPSPSPALALGLDLEELDACNRPIGGNFGSEPNSRARFMACFSSRVIGTAFFLGALEDAEEEDRSAFLPFGLSMRFPTKSSSSTLRFFLEAPPLLELPRRRSERSIFCVDPDALAGFALDEIARLCFRGRAEAAFGGLASSSSFFWRNWSACSLRRRSRASSSF